MEMGLSLKYLLFIKCAKIDVLKKWYDNDKVKYFSCIQVSRVMILNNFYICFFYVFDVLMGFLSVCCQVFEVVFSYVDYVFDVEQ